ncbi:MAG: fibronectin type III domain-containing protein [Nitrospirae bacterium]|nr:fibronectin type III domain-containing protein [Nitrospirota bacterium]
MRLKDIRKIGIWSVFLFLAFAIFYNLIGCGTIAPTAPTGVTATAGDGQVTISWSSITGATSYNIYWSTTTGVTKTSGTKIPNVTSPYTHPSLTNNTPYYYVVTAVNANGESMESAQVSAHHRLLQHLIPW